jgi:HAD superfamily, subfamily IIIB (Acid phosphatase)
MRLPGNKAIVAALVGVAAIAGVALARSSRESVVPYPANGQMLYGVRPTAVGLPDIGQSGTIGANALPALLRTYHDSGAYERDLAAVDTAAQNYIAGRLAAARTGRRLTGKPALVLDIDETSLSNYAQLAAQNFDAAALVAAAVGTSETAIQPTLRLYRAAIAHHVAVFFVTGRPSLIDAISKSNLRRVGYNKGWAALYEKPATAGVARFKSATRASIEKRGFDIVANVGDQQSDLDGGHADRAFKLPNPFYFIAD